MGRTLVRVAAVLWTLYVALLVLQGGVEDPRGVLLLLLPPLAVLLALSFVPRGRRRQRLESAEPEPREFPRRKAGIMKRVSGCIGAILVTTLGGLAVWWVTRPGGPVDPIPSPYPSVRILALDIAPIIAGPTSTATATVTVHNEGDATAEDCRVNWYSHGMSYAATSSPTFALPRQETRVLHLQSLVYSSQGNYPSQTVVLCSNASSESVPRDVIVRPEM